MVSSAPRRRSARLAPLQFQRHRSGVRYAGATSAGSLDAAELHKDGTGIHTVWPATELLVDFFTAEQRWLTASSAAIELGAGLGIAGMHAARLGVAHVTVTDYHHLVLERLNASIRANGLSTSCYAKFIDWEQATRASLAKHTLVFGADLAVSTRAASHLATIVQHLLATEGCFLYSHLERRAIYCGADGKLAMEASDTALDALRAQLTLPSTGLECREIRRVRLTAADTSAHGSAAPVQAEASSDGSADAECLVLLAFGRPAALNAPGCPLLPWQEAQSRKRRRA